jgi:uncharacterized DUF497 family protein
MYEWDAAKAEANLAKHGTRFELVHDFDWKSVIEREDGREDYGELRMVALGFIGRRLHVLIYTPRGDAIRVISLRRAGKREVQAYNEAQT